MTKPQTPKAILRDEVRRRRKSLLTGSSDVRASAVAINAVQLLREFAITSGPVAAFVSLPDEPPTDVLLNGLTDLGYPVWLPRVVDSTTVEWVAYDGYLEQDLLGIPAPAGSPLQLSAAKAIFIPAVAASADGRRLGRGAGYYDRALAGLPRFEDGGPLRIAVVDQCGALPAELIPMDEHDAWVDAILVG